MDSTLQVGAGMVAWKLRTKTIYATIIDFLCRIRDLDKLSFVPNLLSFTNT